MSSRVKQKTAVTEKSLNGLTLRVTIEARTGGRGSKWSLDDLNEKAKYLMARIEQEMRVEGLWLEPPTAAAPEKPGGTE